MNEKELVFRGILLKKHFCSIFCCPVFRFGSFRGVFFVPRVYTLPEKVRLRQNKKSR